MIHEINLVGILLSAIFYELTGIVAGGFISPIILARYSGKQIAVNIFISIIIWILISIVSNHTIIYGRRKFVLCIIFSSIISYGLLEFDNTLVAFVSIVPGLIANNIDSQGLIKTVFSTILLTYILKIIIMVMI